MDPYLPYVVGAYALVFGAVTGLVLWVVADRAGARRALRRAEGAATRARDRRAR
ncbi:heme exporter protein CcmD [Acuticoccus sp.]|uniref:heme exporter protein CcmD n=1 Tax=Acuticoccus sp. TaxID=1904378 RepID=UPI003B51C72F